jgi:hypothetical protein
MLDYENEFQFQFQLEIVSPRARPSNKLKMQGMVRVSFLTYRDSSTIAEDLRPRHAFFWIARRSENNPRHAANVLGET